MGRCVVVLGMHRSGTSATAGVLHHLGVNMGPVLLGATDANEKGHFEDHELAVLNEQALGSWHTPVPRQSHYRAQYERLFVDRSRRSDLWGMKDPRMCLVFSDVESWLRSTPGVDDVRVVVVRRPFHECVASLCKRDGWSRERAIQIQSIYQYKLLETVEGFSGDMLELEFADLISDPTSTVAKIAAFAHSGLGHGATPEQLQQAAAFIDPNLRHHSDAVPTKHANVPVPGKETAA